MCVCVCALITLILINILSTQCAEVATLNYITIFNNRQGIYKNCLQSDYYAYYAICLESAVCGRTLCKTNAYSKVNDVVCSQVTAHVCMSVGI